VEVATNIAPRVSAPSRSLLTTFGLPFGLSIVVAVNMPLPTKSVAQVVQPIDFG